MDELQSLLADSASRLFKDASESALDAAQFNHSLWSAFKDLGFSALLLPQEKGGVGGSWSYADTILRPAGYHSIPLPCGEAILAAHLLDSAGLVFGGELMVAAPSLCALTREGDRFRFQGRLRGVPWGRYADAVVTTGALDGQPHVVLLSPGQASVREAVNLAGEPRDDLTFTSCEVEAAACDVPAVRQTLEYAALLRLAQVVGAMECALSLSIDYANERKQFGRVIGKFQAVQQQLAIFGSEVAAVTCAVRSAFVAADTGDAGFQIAAAKLRANMAIGTATATAHQVHAAIGFTWEHRLRLSTQRLLSWRSEYGNDSYWSSILGAEIVRRGAEHFWRDLTRRDDEVAAL